MNWVQPKFTDFVIPSAKKRKTTTVTNGNTKNVKCLKEKVEELTWTNRWKPRKKSDLVVNKKKIEEIEIWLASTKKATSSSFLLLYGPPGCGKFTTLKVLCDENRINLLEWTPQIALTSYNPDSISNVPYQSEISKFEEFVMRATRYSNVLNSNSCRLITVKDVPNQYIKDTSLFQNFVSKFNDINDVNIVFIVSDFKISRELFNDDLKRKFNIRTIQFNPITQKNTFTALQKIAQGKYSEYLDSISLSSAGDLRNAITTLQFLSTKGTLPQKKKQPIPANSKSESIDLFHGIGRVLYAKKENGKLKHCPNDISESFISLPDLFIRMLHENYLETFSSIHEIAKASDCLSESDLLLKPIIDSDSFNSLALTVASHGLMSNNSNPIKKFQQFNRPKRITNILAEYRAISKDSESLIDIVSYGRDVPTFANEHKVMLTKLKAFGKSYLYDLNCF